MATEIGSLHRDTIAVEVHTPARCGALVRHKALDQGHAAVEVGALLQAMYSHSVAR
jgi:hypothetical protein